MMMNPGKFLSKEERVQITEAIKTAELNTSGEIRVHIESHVAGEVLDRAAYVFQFLDMHKTTERNGVLFYIAIDDKKFAILGDAGINAKLGENYWGKISEVMTTHFASGDFAAGLSEGIIMAGEQLKLHFPYQKNDINELPDEISFGN